VEYKYLVQNDLEVIISRLRSTTVELEIFSPVLNEISIKFFVQQELTIQLQPTLAAVLTI
jgi:hypothetical protein